MRDDEEAPMRDRSEMRAAPVNELPVSQRDTLQSVPSAPPVERAPEDDEPARSERIMDLEERLERQLLEIRDLTRERFALIAIADQRAERSTECLEHAREARAVIKAYVDACNRVEKQVGGSFTTEWIPEELRKEADEAYQALVAFIAKPL